MSQFLMFSSQEEAVTANLKLFENLARTKAQVLRTATDELVDPATIAAGDLVAMVYAIPGFKQGVAQLEDGLTTKYGNIIQCDNGAGYVLQKPDDSLMTGVVYDTIEDEDQAWYPNEVI